MDDPGICFDAGVSAEITDRAFRDTYRRAGLDPDTLEPVATLAIDADELVGAAS
jgi:cobalamin biosynthesis protein CbiG